MHFQWTSDDRWSQHVQSGRRLRWNCVTLTNKIGLVDWGNHNYQEALEKLVCIGPYILSDRSLFWAGYLGYMGVPVGTCGYLGVPGGTWGVHGGVHGGTWGYRGYRGYRGYWSRARKDVAMCPLQSNKQTCCNYRLKMCVIRVQGCLCFSCS